MPGSLDTESMKSCSEAVQRIFSLACLLGARATGPSKHRDEYRKKLQKLGPANPVRSIPKSVTVLVWFAWLLLKAITGLTSYDAYQRLGSGMHSFSKPRGVSNLGHSQSIFSVVCGLE